VNALVDMRGISQRFGHITALSNVDLNLYQGEVLALLGDNGAGKSTLIKVLTGVHQPTEGRIAFDGQAVDISSPAVAHTLGIETVYQDLALIPRMSISRNFYLGRELTKRVGPFTVLDHETMRQRAETALSEIGITVRDADEPVGALSGGERQSIAIGRAVHFGSRVLILDEPTSALSIGETRKVLGYIRAAKDEGMSVIFITHNLHHVFEVADRVVVLSHGEKIGDFPRDDVSEDRVAEMIMGEGARQSAAG
jgi:simple sugar transport system ATP-binding protein